MRIKQMFNAVSSFNKLWNLEIFIRINLKLMGFILGISCQKE